MTWLMHILLFLFYKKQKETTHSVQWPWMRKCVYLPWKNVANKELNSLQNRRHPVPHGLLSCCSSKLVMTIKPLEAVYDNEINSCSLPDWVQKTRNTQQHLNMTVSHMTVTFPEGRFYFQAFHQPRRYRNWNKMVVKDSFYVSIFAGHC